jgi:rare lipoprotein A
MKTNKSLMKKIVSGLILMLLSSPVSPTYLNLRQEIQIGKASYYAPKFNGRVTASGEIFNANEYTCAHKTIPFNTYLKVTNLANSKSVIVRVNDRGPYVRGRIIDLSAIAARDIKMMDNGTTKVRIEIIGVNKYETYEYQASPFSEIEKYSFED